MKLAVSLALLLAAAAPSAQAQLRRDEVPRQRAGAPARAQPDPFTAVDPRPEYERCVPWCPQDLNPCHPPEFKIADGRCARDSD